MHPETFRFTFDPRVPVEHADLSFQLAVLAAEGLHGEAGVRLAAVRSVDRRRHAINVAVSDEVGSGIVRMFTNFLSREFGDDAFSVARAAGGRGRALPCR